MSGHSKWSQIKRAKGVADVKRGLAFTKLSTLISVAVHEGGGIGDPSLNMRLRVVVDRAKEANMPKENITRAIERALSAGGQASREAIYEGFWHNNVVLLILANTDNPNRTVAAVRYILEKQGGKLGAMGSVAYQFQKCLLLEIVDKYSEDEKLDLALQLEAIDMITQEERLIFYLPFVGGAKKIPPELEVVNLKTHYQCTSHVEISDEEMMALSALLEKLEDLDDVVEVFTNVL